MDSAFYNLRTQVLTLFFLQAEVGNYPAASISIEDANAVPIDSSVACHGIVAFDDDDIYISGFFRYNDDAAANVIFTALDLTDGGQLSGHFEGMAEHFDHPDDILTPLEMTFSNIPVKLFEEEISEASGTLGDTELTFQNLAGVYDTASQELRLDFSQADTGSYPVLSIAMNDAAAIEIGSPVGCNIIIAMDSIGLYCGGYYANNPAAVAWATFSRLELSSDGSLSGNVEGLVEHIYHPGEDLYPFQLEFANIPVIVY